MQIDRDTGQVSDMCDISVKRKAPVRTIMILDAINTMILSSSLLDGDDRSLWSAIAIRFRDIYRRCEGKKSGERPNRVANRVECQ